jgi:protein gp37
MADSKIEWTRGPDGSKGKVWNPIRGCSPVSEGCRNCYAARFAHRFSAEGQRYEGLTKLTENGPAWKGEVRLVPEFLSYPLRWNKPRRVFVNSMSDLFHPKVSNSFIAAVFGVMAVCRRHTFQILTKRPERLASWFEWVQEEMKGRHINPALGHHAAAMVDTFSEKEADRIYQAINKMGFGRLSEWPLPNVWLGVSVEDQVTAEKRVPKLLAAPAAVRWISIEPMLGAVLLGSLELATFTCKNCGADQLGEGCGCGAGAQPAHDLKREWHKHWPIDWIVCGGESGPKARPVNPAWVRSIRDQCQAAGVPFLFKQWGEWKPHYGVEEVDENVTIDMPPPPAGGSHIIEAGGRQYHFEGVGSTWMRWTGKHVAGRELDGKIWDEYPGQERG